MKDKFAQPQDVTGADMAFGHCNVYAMMPPYSEIRDYDRQGNKGHDLFSEWFYCGLKSVDGLKPREGIDKAKALAHIQSIMRSCEPKHEHKTAGCAYLFEKWFDLDASTWERAKLATL